MRPAASVKAEEDVSRMYRPTDPKIVNGHVVERTPEDQELIESFANAFLLPKEREMIASILARNINQLRFDAVEAEIISTRHEPTFLSGVSSQGHFGMPISQFYDFILTIDNALAYLRGLHVEVMNLRQIGTKELVDQLKTTIIHEDGVPWELADSPYYRKLDETSSAQKPEKMAYQLDSEKTMWEDSKGSWQLLPRSTYDKSVDEAYIYNSPVYRLLVGLQQGLFLVKHTIADKLRIGPMGRDKPADRDIISIGNWINTWAVAPGTQILPYMGESKDVTTQAILKKHGIDHLQKMIKSKWGGAKDEWVKGDTIEDDKPLGEWRPHYYLFPKIYGLMRYPLNWCGRVFVSSQFGGSSTEALKFFGYPHTDDLFTKGHEIPPGGGPLAYWNCNFIKGVATDKIDVWMRTEIISGAPSAPRPAPAPSSPRPSVESKSPVLVRVPEAGPELNDDPAYHENDKDPETSIGFHAIETDWESVTAAMTAMAYHPIFACPRLSSAYAASGVGSVLQNMYRMLQRHFVAQYKNIDQLAMVQPDARRILMSATRSMTYLSPGSCPANSQPRYVTYQGQTVDEMDATFQDSNGIRWMRSHIDPSRCSCEPLVRALTFSTSNPSRYTEPRTIPLRVPMSTAFLTPEEIQRQISSKNRTFSEAAGDSGGVFTQALSAMVAGKSRVDGVDNDETDESSDKEDTDEDNEDQTEKKSHTRISRKNNPDYEMVYRTTKSGIKQRFYVRKTASE
jgi:hypothetical protein